jgi:hypothetical protein
MATKAEISKDEFLRRMERSVQHAERQPEWMRGRPENRQETQEKEPQRTSERATSASTVATNT